MKLNAHTSIINDVDVSEDDSTVLSASVDGTASITSLRHSPPKPLALIGHAQAVNAIIDLVDTSVCITGSADKTLKVGQHHVCIGCLHGPLLNEGTLPTHTLHY
jgi:WD40 repeat protein